MGGLGNARTGTGGYESSAAEDRTGRFSRGGRAYCARWCAAPFGQAEAGRGEDEGCGAPATSRGWRLGLRDQDSIDGRFAATR